MAKIIQIATTEKTLHILFDNGEIYGKRIDRPGDIWDEVEPPILTGKGKNIKSKEEAKITVV